jgi:hypothetical protein
MNAVVRNLVRSRADGRCEYCQLGERQVTLFPFHLEHIVARKHGGLDDEENLCGSCHHCNLAKSSNLSGRDPDTGKVVRLFNPRSQHWRRHFRWDGARLQGRTQCGRATIAVLNINAPHRIEIRANLIAAGAFPPR